jgi:hypothetical protein
VQGVFWWSAMASISSGIPPPAAPAPVSDACVSNCAFMNIALYQGLVYLTPFAFTFFIVVLLCVLHFRFRGGNRRRSGPLNMLLPIRTAGHGPGFGGLAAEEVETFPVQSFEEWQNEKHTEDGQCAVCLGDYTKTDSLRLLPCHAFHVSCIDAWLSQNTTCPVCRTNLHSAPADTPADAANVDPADGTASATSASSEEEDGSPRQQTSTEQELTADNVALSIQPAHVAQPLLGGENTLAESHVVNIPMTQLEDAGR